MVRNHAFGSVGALHCNNCRCALTQAIKELLDLGIHIVIVSGMDSRQASFSTMAAVISAARRGQEGKALACRPTGGKAYGYRSTVLPDGAKAFAIVEAEAEIVRGIFREYAA